MSAERTISLTGATGHLGTALLPELMAQGYRVKCLYHKKRPSFTHSDITWIQGSLSQEENLKELVKGSGAIIHAASIISIGGKVKDPIYEANVNGTQKVIETCLRENCKLIYISSVAAVEEPPTGKTLTEQAPYRNKSTFYYGWTKAEAEKKIQAAIEEAGLRAVILRPTALVGPPDPAPSHFGQVIFDLSKGKLPFITSGGFNLLDVRDFARTVVNSINSGKPGEIYFTGGQFCTIRELASHLRPERVPLQLPVALLLRMIPAIDLYQRLFPMKWPIDRESLLTLKNAPREIDSSKARSHLGHEVRSWRESCDDLVNWWEKPRNIKPDHGKP